MLTNIKNAIHIKYLSSDLILELQTSLSKLNYSVGSLDGLFGNDTLFAFNRFKEDFNLTHPNFIGPTTVRFLNLALKGEIDRDEQDSSIHPSQPSFSSPNFVPSYINWVNFNCPISKYFSVGEVSKFSKDRIVHNAQHRLNALKLAKFLDEIREDWGKPIGVTSWYRPQKVNTAVGGARNSQHLTGSAVDIYPINSDGLKFEQWLNKRWTRALGYGQKSSKGFTHLDLRLSIPSIRWNY